MIPVCKRNSLSRREMTICIAARCSGNGGLGRHIVTVSDMKLTTGMYSSDMATLKLRHLSALWKCLVAGKFPQHRLLVDPLIELLCSDEAPKTYAGLMKAVTDAFIAANKKLAEESVLSGYGLTIDEFVKRRSDLGDSLYERLWSEIGRVKIGCDLLVCGFDDGGLPHVCIASNPTEENPSFMMDCDFPGFATIGTGGYIADSYLYACEQNPASHLVPTIYNTMCAKFLAESASDVGETSYLYVFGSDGSQIEIGGALEEKLREQWVAHGKPAMHTDMLNTISRALPLEGPKQLDSQTSRPGQ
jgi:hypothetical protein